MLISIPQPPKLDINLDLLNSPEFKEDSVREEVIAPILKSLGYSAIGTNRIIRSRSLNHNFIRVGSKDRPVKIIPDYLLEIDEKVVLVLDAKAPNEVIDTGGNVEQAYSYAIHREIRSEKFALCNGRFLTVFSIYDSKYVKSFDLLKLEDVWTDLYKTLCPTAFLDPDILDYAPDFGTALLRMGFTPLDKISMFGLPIDHIGKIDDKRYTTMKNATIENREYAASFDFNRKILDTILDGLPKLEAQKISNALKRQPFKVSFPESMFFLDIEAKISPFFEETSDGRESIIPLKLHSVKLTHDSTGFSSRMKRTGKSNPWTNSKW